MARKLLAILVCLLVMTFCGYAGAAEGDKRIWSGVAGEVEFVPGRTYTAGIYREEYKALLRIYEGKTLVFETRVTPGAYGPMATTSLREGRTDLVVLLSAGSAGVINTFLIVGVLDDGSFGVLADLSYIKGWPTRAKLVELDGKVGVEMSPFGLWTRYRVDIAWDRDAKRMAATGPVRVSYAGEPPPADKTVFFNLPVPYKSRVRIYADGADVREVRLRPGERLLLRRDAATHEEVSIVCFSFDTSPVIGIKAVDGNTLITAKSRGETRVSLAQPHFVSDTYCDLRIIVEE
jgi:hypothetical protein